MASHACSPSSREVQEPVSKRKPSAQGSQIRGSPGGESPRHRDWGLSLPPPAQLLPPQAPLPPLLHRQQRGPPPPPPPLLTASYSSFPTVTMRPCKICPCCPSGLPSSPLPTLPGQTHSVQCFIASELALPRLRRSSPRSGWLLPAFYLPPTGTPFPLLPSHLPHLSRALPLQAPQHILSSEFQPQCEPLGAETSVHCCSRIPGTEASPAFSRSSTSVSRG